MKTILLSLGLGSIVLHYYVDWPARVDHPTVRPCTSQSRPSPRPIQGMDGRFAWLHIEKTGTSFTNALLRLACDNVPAGFHSITPNEYEESIRNLMLENPSACREDFRLVPFLEPEWKQWHSWLSEDLYEHFRGALVGFFREPAAHRKSLFTHRYDQVIKRVHYDELKEYMTKKANGELSVNPIQVFLEYTRGYQMERLTNTKFHQPTFWEQDELHQKGIVLESFRMAKERLQNFQFVGITNRYDESMCLFHFMFHFPRGCDIGVFRAMNTASGHTPPSYNLTEHDIETMKTHNYDIDGLLYDEALRIFETNLRLYGVSEESCIKAQCWPTATAGPKR